MCMCVMYTETWMTAGLRSFLTRRDTASSTQNPGPSSTATVPADCLRFWFSRRRYLGFSLSCWSTSLCPVSHYSRRSAHRGQAALLLWSNPHLLSWSSRRTMVETWKSGAIYRPLATMAGGPNLDGPNADYTNSASG